MFRGSGCLNMVDGEKGEVGEVKSETGEVGKIKTGVLSTTWQLVKLALPLFLSSASWVRLYACFIVVTYFTTPPGWYEGYRHSPTWAS